jgi:branched-chain amino acid transport system ATP-binding protein
LNLLVIENLSKAFGGFKALDRVTLNVDPGEKRAVIGPNGAGKSTLFNLITGKYKPTSGHILLEGEDIGGMPPYKITDKGIARSFQITNIFPNMTVFENIRNAQISRHKMRSRLTSRLKGIKEIREDTEALMELMALTDRRNVPVSALSYGEQREIEIALTLALNPKLILLDEPTAGLNKKETEKIIELIRRVTVDKTLMIVEHDMHVVFSLAQRISVLYYGGVLETGSKDEIQNSEKVKKAYLGDGLHA